MHLLIEDQSAPPKLPVNADFNSSAKPWDSLFTIKVSEAYETVKHILWYFGNLWSACC